MKTVQQVDNLVEAERALYTVILLRGKQCLSQASMRTGFGIAELERARDSLVRKGLIRPVPGQEDREPDYYSYEADV